ncbi:MAG TPA: AraC family transcriptional regulator, partial [Polyangiaceae bacterium]|nr:AraC family transcriptional regulator [Polyangiaceae bacterium]
SLALGKGNQQALSDEANVLKARLAETRTIERTWETARSMVDERSARQWSSPSLKPHLKRLAVEKPLEHVLVGFATSAREQDAISGMLKTYAFQRECVDGLRPRKDVVWGPVGDHGVMLLFGGVRGARVRRAAEEMARSVAALARRRFGLAFHVGVSAPSVPASLPARYEQALAAAEQALWEGRSLLHAEPRARSRSSLRHARRNLGVVSAKRPQALAAEFARYSEAVAIHSGYRVEPARAHLEAGFDKVAETLLSQAALDEIGYEDLCEKLERAARDAATLGALAAAYRPAIADLVSLVENPARAQQDRSLSKSLSFIREHFAGPITLTQAARVAGFAPAYFCRLFKKREGTTFEAYLRRLRVERAKELLTGTELGIARVAELSGFALRSHFHRVFSQAVGSTPRAYRLHAASGQAGRLLRRVPAQSGRARLARRLRPDD